MAKTTKKVDTQYIGRLDKNFLKEEYRTATTTPGAPAAGQFYSEIQNRADMIDLSKDLGVRFGINRIQTQQIYQIQDETGPNGEPVYGVANDRYGQIRCVGSGWFNANTTYGVRTSSTVVNDFVEITFYGTGLNYISPSISARDIQAAVDGGANGPNIVPTGAADAPLGNRNYGPNIVLSVVSGLTLGIHTVKLTLISGVNIELSGFEILNEASTLLVPEGTYYVDGKEIIHAAEETIAYNSGWTNEYGTAGTKGGCVVVYMDENGQIKKDVQWTDTGAAKILTDTDHSNEEIIARHYWREFGAGRPDDFSTLTISARNSAFTLDDGTTTLVGQLVEATTNSPGFRIGAAGNFITITFVGTGLDITYDEPAANDTTVFDIEVDGVNQFSGAGSSLFTTGAVGNVLKVCSGLPYGTHTVKFNRTTGGGNNERYRDFIVYGPKKPQIEDSSVELGSYYLMSDFVANTTQSATALSTGIVRKMANREMTYTGTWTAAGAPDPSFIDPIGIRTVAQNSAVEYTFFGTGFDFRNRHDSSVTVQATLDGSITDFTPYTTSYYGAGTFTASTGILSAGFSNDNAGLVISGLPLGVHTIKFEKTDAIGNSFFAHSMDIITLIHSPKLNGPFVLQNTLRVGNQSIGDSKELMGDSLKNNAFLSEAVNGSHSTTSTILVPVSDMYGTIVTSGGDLEIGFSVEVANTAGYIGITIFIDGKNFLIGPNTQLKEQSTARSVIGGNYTIPVAPGTHHVKMFYLASGGTALINDFSRFLSVKEVFKK